MLLVKGYLLYSTRDLSIQGTKDGFLLILLWAMIFGFFYFRKKRASNNNIE